MIIQSVTDFSFPSFCNTGNNLCLNISSLFFREHSQTPTIQKKRELKQPTGEDQKLIQRLFRFLEFIPSKVIDMLSENGI